MALINEEQAKKAGYFIAGHFSNLVNKLTGIRRRIDDVCKENNIDSSNLEQKTQFLKEQVGHLHLTEREHQTQLSAMTAYEMMYVRYVILKDDKYEPF